MTQVPVGRTRLPGFDALRVGDDEITRREPLAHDDALTVGRAGHERPEARAAVLDHERALLPRVLDERRDRHHEATLLARRDRDLGLLVDREPRQRCVECDVHLELPRRGVALARDARDLAAHRLAGPEADRRRHADAHAPHDRLVDPRRDPQRRRVHHTEDRRTGHDRAAGLDQALDDDPVYRGGQARVRQHGRGVRGLLCDRPRLRLAGGEQRFGVLEIRLGRTQGRGRAVHHGLRDVTRPQEVLVPAMFGAREIQLRLGLCDRRLRGRHVPAGGLLRLDRPRALGGEIAIVERRDQLSARDRVALVHVQLRDGRGDPRAQRDRDARLDGARPLDRHRHRALGHRDGLDRRRVSEHAVERSRGEDRHDDPRRRDPDRFARHRR